MSKVSVVPAGRHFLRAHYRLRPKLVVSSDGRGVINHAGSRLLADLADATGLTASFTDTLRRLRPRGTGHAPGRIAVDLAVMLADGGEHH